MRKKMRKKYKSKENMKGNRNKPRARCIRYISNAAECVSRNYRGTSSQVTHNKHITSMPFNCFN